VGDEQHGATDLSYKAGMIYHLGNHILLAGTFSPQQEIGNSVRSSGGAKMPGFAQPIRIPMVFTTGLGWIPNRFFSAGFSISAVGPMRDTGLLRDQNITVGSGGLTLQPKIGASYIFGQFNHLKIAGDIGSYYETPRVQGEPHRLHGTAALQVNPYFLNLGLGVDRATRYNNFFVSIGFDIVRLVRAFDIIPPDPVPPINGFFPEPLEKSSDGLPEPLTIGEGKIYSGPTASDVGEIIKNVPKNIENKFNGKPSVQETEATEAALKLRSKAKKRRRKRKTSVPRSEPAPSSAPALVPTFLQE
jgi:hypothetical protein